MTLAFDIKLVRHSWIKATLKIDDKQIDIEASALSDGLNDFLCAVMILAEGVSESICKWEQEPGEYEWKFHRQNNKIEIDILEFKKTFNKQYSDEGKSVFSCTIEFKKFIKKVLNVFNRLSLEYNAVEYKELWGYDFPQDEL